MAGFLASKMRKVQEAIGQATVTEDSAEVKDVKDHLKQLKTINTNLSRYSRQYAAQESKLAETGEKLAECFLEYSSLYPASPLGESLVRAAETEQALASLRHALSSQMIEFLVNQAKRSLEEDLKRASELKSSQEEARLVFDMQKKKYKDLQPKAEDPKTRTKFEEAEQLKNAAESNYLTMGQQLVNRLNDFDTRSSQDVIFAVKNYTMAQQEHFSSGAALFQQVVPHIQQMEKNNDAVLSTLKKRASMIPSMEPSVAPVVAPESLHHSQGDMYNESMNQTPPPPQREANYPMAGSPAPPVAVYDAPPRPAQPTQPLYDSAPPPSFYNSTEDPTAIHSPFSSSKPLPSPSAEPINLSKAPDLYD